MFAAIWCLYRHGSSEFALLGWEDTLKTFAIAMLATLMVAGTASARGGGGAMGTMPGTNYTDMPPYTPKLVHDTHKHVGPHRAGKIGRR